MNILQQILEHNCLEEKTGLLLLSMPTGFGKTHNVLDFIYQNYQQFKQQNRKIIFLTNLKKNLPHQDLKQRFFQDNQEKEYQENVLFINSNLDFVQENLLNLDQEIPDKFKKTKNYQNLKQELKKLKKNLKASADYQSWLKNEIRQKYEPAFRGEIKQQLDEKSKKKQDRLALIKNNPDYQWISKLYPTVFTDEKTILFMSMDKFFLKNSTLIEPAYYCYDKLASQSLIFIDEFDATKDTILNQIIETGKKHKIDLISLFKNIHNHLQNSEFPQSLLKESETRQKSAQNKKWKSLSEILEEFIQDSENIFKQFYLEYTYKSAKNNTNKSRNFLFYDYESHHVLDRRLNPIIDTSKEDKVNWIKAFFYNDDSYKNKDKISYLVAQIGGFLTYFQRGVGFLAENYQNFKKESGDEVYSLESAIRSILDYFKLDSETINLLTANILEKYSAFAIKNPPNIRQLQSFYEVGFRYHDIVDNDNHDLNSKIYFYNFNRTPEAFIAEVAQKAMLVGISATASIDSNIGNYDLNYLQQYLKDSFYYLSQTEINQLKNEYEKITAGYDKITIKTKFIGTESEDEALTTLENIIDDEECANDLLNKSQGETYIFCRYLKILEAWQYFQQNQDCQAFICFLNKFPKAGDPTLNLDILEEYFCYVKKHNATRDYLKSIRQEYYILTSNNFDNDLPTIKERLAQGKRIFLISTYQTLGAGVNLQYSIPANYTPIKINDFESRGLMDISGVYLEKPTNLIVSLNTEETIEDETFIKYLFQLEFLLENGTMSRKQFEDKLDEAFHKYIGESYYRSKNRINFYQTSAFAKYLNKVIIQALGRICRTNMKAPNIHIVADNGIQTYLNNFNLPQDIIPIKEYQELVKNAQKSTKVTNEIKIRAENISHQGFKYIQNRLNSIWKAKDIEQWQSLRQQVLRQPTIAKKKDCENSWSKIYIELPKPGNYYRFNQENDYGQVEIFFDKNQGEQEVSEISSRLLELIKIDLLQELFIENNWATKFQQAELILSPPMFNNIYKGALGEVCGKHILETQLKLKLQELDDKEYERFDFKTENGIYFDFKFWSETFDKDETPELEKIKNKMAEIEARQVFIINLLADERPFVPIASDNDAIIRIPFLCQNNQINEQALKYLLGKLN
jgi:hypothetical protein